MTVSGPSATCERGPSQNHRVLAALRRGPVNPVMFAELPTVDGGAPVLRLAARIGVLRSRGHIITSAKQPNGTATYTLTFDAEKDAERHDNQPTGEARGERRSLTGGVVSLGVHARPHGSGGASLPSLEPTLFDWPVVAA